MTTACEASYQLYLPFTMFGIYPFWFPFMVSYFAALALSFFLLFATSNSPVTKRVTIKSSDEYVYKKNS